LPQQNDYEIGLETVNCSQCGSEIGQPIEVGGEVLLQIGGLVMREIHGNCALCGEPFDYSLNSRRLEKLLKRVVEREDS